MTDPAADGVPEPSEVGPAGEPIAEPDAPEPALVAFRSREFRIFFTAGLISNTGTWMQTVTVPFVIDQLTHSTALVGLSAFCTYFPATIVSPLAGSLADRHDRRNVLMWAQAVMMAMAAVLWLLWSTGTATTASILAAVIIGALGTGVTTAAWQSYVPQLVPRPAMLSAVRLNSMQFTGARAVGPALGGLVLATLGPAAAFGINAVSFLAVIGALLLLTPRPPEPLAEDVGVMRHFREGVRYLRRREVFVVSVLLVCFIAMFGVALVQLLEPFTRHVLDVGAGVYGLLTAGYGAGAVVGGVFMVAFGDTFRRSHLATVGLFAMAVGTVALGFSPGWVLALGALFVMGAAQVFCTVSCNLALQVNVDENFRGRISSLFLMSFFAAAPLGALIGGIIGEAVGLRPTIVGAAVCLTLLTLWAFVRYGRLHSLDEAEPIADTVVGPHPAPHPAPLPVDLDGAGHLTIEPVTIEPIE